MNTENTDIAHNADDHLEELFQMPADFELVKSESDGEQRCIKGFASTEDLDQDGEQILQRGIDFSYLRDKGFLNYDHQYLNSVGGAKVPVIIGFPTLVEMRDKGLWVEGRLLKGDPMASEKIRLANEVWELGLALQKAGSDRRLAYSVEGKILERRGNKIVKSAAHHAAVTHKPVNNLGCSIEMFVKSLCCGSCSPDSPTYNPAKTCCNKHMELPEDGMPHLMAALEKALETTNSGPISTQRTSPLMVEGLDRVVTTVLYGDTPCADCFIPETGKFHRGIHGAFNHMRGCLGYGVDDTNKFLKGLVYGARKSHELSTLIKTAGFVRQ